MEKLNNWNAWCNDKVLLHSEEGLPILLSPNAILGIQQTSAGTEIALVDGLYFTATEKVEDILAAIGDLITESEARKAAQAEEQRKQYEEMMKAEQAKKASEG